MDEVWIHWIIAWTLYIMEGNKGDLSIYFWRVALKFPLSYRNLAQQILFFVFLLITKMGWGINMKDRYSKRQSNCSSSGRVGFQIRTKGMKKNENKWDRVMFCICAYEHVLFECEKFSDSQWGYYWLDLIIRLTCLNIQMTIALGQFIVDLISACHQTGTVDFRLLVNNLCVWCCDFKINHWGHFFFLCFWVIYCVLIDVGQNPALSQSVLKQCLWPAVIWDFINSYITISDNGFGICSATYFCQYGMLTHCILIKLMVKVAISTPWLSTDRKLF